MLPAAFFVTIRSLLLAFIQAFCLDSLCGYLIHALANISIHTEDESAAAWNGNAGNAGDAATPSIYAAAGDFLLQPRQSAGKTLSGVYHTENEVMRTNIPKAEKV